MHALSRIIPVLALAGVCAAASFVPAAAADKPVPLGTAKSWSAYQRTTSDGKVCYALANPTTSEPKKAKRDPIYFLINDWSARKVKGEIQVVPGYAYKDGEPVTVTIGTLNIDFFAKNDGNNGSAWVKDPADETKLLNAMRQGATLKVSGVSKRGTKTTDTYSLSGLSAMLDKVHEACAK